MTNLYLSCALFGGTLLICQTLLTFIGLGGDHDVSGDGHGDVPMGDTSHAGDTTHSDHASSTWFFGVLTIRTIVAALTFFGLGGMASLTSNIAEGPALVIAVLSGFSAMYIVHWLMRQLRRLRSDGTVSIDSAVGLKGSVYLKVPGAHRGAGKIHVSLQNRTVELTAWTNEAELATGVPIVVTKIVGPETVEVTAIAG